LAEAEALLTELRAFDNFCAASGARGAVPATVANMLLTAAPSIAKLFDTATWQRAADELRADPTVGGIGAMRQHHRPGHRRHHRAGRRASFLMRW
jgi:hypothetical protein